MRENTRHEAGVHTLGGMHEIYAAFDARVKPGT
jgi:hypothetical protein